MKPVDPRLLRAVPAVRRPLGLLAGVGALQGVATIGLAFALTRLVVAVVGGTPLVAPGAWVAGVFAVRAVLGWLAETVAARAGVEVSTAVRRTVLTDWATRPVEERPDPTTATTLAAQGASAVEPYAARFLPALVAAAVVPVLAVGCLVLVDPLSALVVVLTLPLLPLFAALIGRRTQEETDRRWATLARLSGHFLDVVRGLPTLVTYGRAERQVDAIVDVSHRHRRATMRTLRIAFLSSTALDLLGSLAVAVVAVTVGLRLTHGTMDLPSGLLAILLAPEAYWPVRRVGQEFHNAADGAAALEALLSRTGAPAAAAVPTAGGTAGVRLQGVAYAHPGSPREVLSGVDLVAGPGLTALTGPSGRGKTTLLELAAGLRTPLRGTVETGRVHLVTQRPLLVSGTVRDNLGLGNGAGDAALWEALRTVGLDGLVASLPEALATRVGDDGFGLSAGQRARVALARATLSDAPVLLLDEPTAHLDGEAAALVHEVVLELSRRRTVVAVTHRPELVALADQHVDLGTLEVVP